jgi:hypothetical protein
MPAMTVRKFPWTRWSAILFALMFVAAGHCFSGDPPPPKRPQPPVPPVKKDPLSVDLHGEMTPVKVEAESKPVDVNVHFPKEPVKVEAESKPVEVQFPKEPLKVEGESKPIEIHLPKEALKLEGDVKPVRVSGEIKPLKVDGRLIPEKVTFEGGKTAVPLEVNWPKEGPTVTVKLEGASQKPGDEKSKCDCTKPPPDLSKEAFWGVMYVILGAGATGGIAQIIIDKARSRRTKPPVGEKKTEADQTKKTTVIDYMRALGRKLLALFTAPIIEPIILGMVAALMVPGPLFFFNSSIVMDNKPGPLLGLFSICLIAASLGLPFIEFVHRWTRKKMSDIDEPSSQSPKAGQIRPRRGRRE